MVLTIKRLLAIIGYTLGLGQYLYFLHFMETKIDFTKSKDIRIRDIQQFKLRYISIWNVILQTVYYAIALVHEVNRYRLPQPLKSQIERVRGIFYSTIAFPCALFVGVVYWSLHNIDHDYVMPFIWGDVMPDWCNYVLHLNIFMLPIIETAYDIKLYVPKMKSAIVGLVMFITVYHGIHFFTYYQTGRWLYKFYEYLDWPQRLIFCLICYGTGVVFLQSGIKIQLIGKAASAPAPRPITRRRRRRRR